MPVPPPGWLTPVEHAVRASMALRGVRPSVEELDAVYRDSAQLPILVDTWLEDPRFGATIRELHDESWLIESAYAPIPSNGALAGTDIGPLKRSLFGEPLRLIEHVVMEDRPYTEIVTADHTLADRIVERAWVGVPDSDDAEDDVWRVTPWDDGRPAAGILSTSVIWMVHRSAGGNFDRGRANVATRALLCLDFLDGDIVVGDIDLADDDAVRDLADDPACAACHDDLDPLASFFLPFESYFVIQESTFPFSTWQPWRVDDWPESTGAPPAYFGEPGDSLADLGAAIAADPSFWTCTARRFRSWFGQTPLEEVPSAELGALTDAFVAADFSAKQLARAVVLSDAMRSDERLLLARPEALGRLLEDLTGWTAEVTIEDLCCGASTGQAPLGDVDLLEDARVGWVTLAGGVDAPFVDTPTLVPTPTSALVLRSAAQAAAEHVVQTELVDDGPRKLLSIGADEVGRVPGQLIDLHLRLYAERVTISDPSVAAAHALWTEVFARSDAVHAWRVTLTAMLQDPRIATY